MINREDIKEGLKFRLPNNKIRYKHQVEGCCDASKTFGPVRYYTTLKTSDGNKNYVTSKIPLFEVCGGPKVISSADKKDPHCAWVGEYIKVRSEALGNQSFHMPLNDVARRGKRAIDANLCPIFSTENPKNNWAYNFIRGGSRSGGKKYRMEHYGCSLDPIGVLAKPSAFTKQPTGDADAFRDITNGMYDTFKAKNRDYGNSFSELFAECGMTYAY